MSRNSRVPKPEKNRVVVGGIPVRSGTRKVAPNMATTCWAPKPIVRGQESRSSGRTIASGLTLAPSPCSFHMGRTFSRGARRSSATRSLRKLGREGGELLTSERFSLRPGLEVERLVEIGPGGDADRLLDVGHQLGAARGPRGGELGGPLLRVLGDLLGDAEAQCL